MEDIYRKTYNGVTCGARLATKVSKTIIAVEVVYHALNKMSFFVSSLEAASALIRIKVKIKANTYRDSLIKLRLGPN
jgi:hypothetical protein